MRKEQVRRIVDKINTLAPDLVLIAGDIIDVDHRILELTWYYAATHIKGSFSR